MSKPLTSVYSSPATAALFASEPFMETSLPDPAEPMSPDAAPPAATGAEVAATAIPRLNYAYAKRHQIVLAADSPAGIVAYCGPDVSSASVLEARRYAAQPVRVVLM
ncbi:MAG: hypothetical protein OEW08_07725, partial [Gammaproteobacteria bacterium]|nr:hypothetical protein [Gammaproteobacteria bacterium]